MESRLPYPEQCRSPTRHRSWNNSKNTFSGWTPLLMNVKALDTPSFITTSSIQSYDDYQYHN